MVRAEIGFCIAVWFVVAATAGAQPLPSADELLRELESLHERRETRMVDARSSAIRALRSASATPQAAIRFYEQTVQDLQFAGTGRGSANFREWQEANLERLRDKTFQTAAQLHLKYLLLSIRRASGEDLSSLLPDLIAYAEEIANDLERQFTGHREMLGEEIGNSLFVRRFNLQGWFRSLENWEMNPGNANGIFERTILPALRENGDARVLAYWDARMKREAEAAKGLGEFREGQFLGQQLPALQMRMAQEYFHLGRVSEGIPAMFQVIRDNPDHASFPNWVAELRTQIEALRPPVPSPEGGD